MDEMMTPIVVICMQMYNDMKTIMYAYVHAFMQIRMLLCK